MNGSSFATAFDQEYGYPADPDALYGYLAARIIDSVVRDAKGLSRFGKKKLKLVVEEAFRSPPWLNRSQAD